MPITQSGGTGTWTLTGNNTYSGGTNITTGTILANGTGNSLGTGVVSVYTSGTLGGTGLTGTGAATAYLGATIEPGTAADTGTLSIAGPATFANTNNGGTGTAAPVLAIKLAPATQTPTNDVLALTGSGASGVLSLATTSDALNLLPQQAITGPQTFTIATFASETGVFDNVTVNGAAAQSTNNTQPNFVSVVYNPTNIQVTVANISAVPEPASIGLLGPAP